MLLVRHSVPHVDPSRPAAEWRLSDEGRARCAQLAVQVAAFEPELLLSSPEPKALETAELIAAALGLAVTVDDELREHDRRTVPFMPRSVFLRRMRTFFARPDEVVVGEESARAALARFSAAVDAISGRAAVVSHGTVIALYVAGSDPDGGFAFWKTLQLPDVVKIR